MRWWVETHAGVEGSIERHGGHSCVVAYPERSGMSISISEGWIRSKPSSEAGVGAAGWAVMFPCEWQLSVLLLLLPVPPCSLHCHCCPVFWS